MASPDGCLLPEPESRAHAGYPHRRGEEWSEVSGAGGRPRGGGGHRPVLARPPLRRVPRLGRSRPGRRQPLREPALVHRAGAPVGRHVLRRVRAGRAEPARTAGRARARAGNRTREPASRRRATASRARRPCLPRGESASARGGERSVLLVLLRLRFDLVAALLCAVHPLRVESVVWISEMRGVASGVFGWAAVLAYLGWAERRAGGESSGAAVDDRWSLLLGAGAFALALLCSVRSRVVIGATPRSATQLQCEIRELDAAHERSDVIGVAHLQEAEGDAGRRLREGDLAPDARPAEGGR